ncbi:alpha/beta fold hydrolase [Luedemannella flava]|uniref:Alpha/beta fold hydrolase n=1 Tax=Luedemannella flava TaxID=349316 RepID=A0ABP4Y4S5_9ACTN
MMRIRLAAVVLLVVGVPAGAAAAPPSGAMVAAADREIVFPVEGTATYGTLHVPRHRVGQRLVAALLLQGGGLVDRNGDLPPERVWRTGAQLAAALGRDGVMTLRFDKYGAGRTGAVRDVDYPALVRQAAAAYQVLRDRPETDRARMLIAGHSEGSLTALLVATGATRPRPAGLVLFEPTSLRFLDQVRRQSHARVAGLVSRGDLARRRQRVVVAAIDRAVADLRAGRRPALAGLPAGMAAMFASIRDAGARYVVTADAVDPLTVARRVRPGTRVLLTCGTREVTVSCAQTRHLAAVLRQARTAGPGRVVIRGTDHFLSIRRRPGVVAAPVLARLHDFVTDGRYGSSQGAAGLRNLALLVVPYVARPPWAVERSRRCRRPAPRGTLPTRRTCRAWCATSARTR